MTEFLVKFFGILAGVGARSLLPWLRKLRDGEIQGFDRRYLFSAMASLIICFIISLLIFPQFTPPPVAKSTEDLIAQTSSPKSDSVLQASTNFEAYFKLFCLAFGFGFGFDGLIKEAGQWVRSYRRRRQSQNPSS